MRVVRDCWIEPFSGAVLPAPPHAGSYTNAEPEDHEFGDPDPDAENDPPWELVASPGFDPSRAVEFWDMTNRQDWHICAQSQLGIESSVYTPGPYANLESMLAAIDREYLAALGRD